MEVKYLILDFGKVWEAIFIDDNESLLDVAKEKGLNVKLMDRDKTNVNSKYEVINDLMNL